MKRFIVKRRGAKIITRTFICDDRDAYLFRSYVWTLNIDKYGNAYLIRGTNTGCFTHFTHAITGATSSQIVVRKNGNCLDLRRENLQIIESPGIRRTKLERRAEP